MPFPKAIAIFCIHAPSGSFHIIINIGLTETQASVMGPYGLLAPAGMYTSCTYFEPLGL